MKLVLQNPAHGGGPLGWNSCNSACGAMLVDLETDGRLTPTCAEVRHEVRDSEPNGPRDTSGGSRPSQIISALKRAFNVTVDGKVDDFEDLWRLGQRSDTAVSLCISYAVVSGTKYDGSPGFTGTHQVVLHKGLIYDPTYDGRRPVIPDGPQKWPKDLVRRASGKYGGVGIGRAVAIIGKAPAVKPSSYSIRFTAGAVYAYSPDGVSRVRIEFSKTTSAPCSAPLWVPWGDGKKRLAEITKGSFKGLRFEPGATHVALIEKK